MKGKGNRHDQPAPRRYKLRIEKMYLNQLIQESQSAIATWEAEIAELQAKILAKQQEIQVYGSIQEAMKSADLQLMNAIKMLDQVCPDELPGYQELIVSRFNFPNPKLIEESAGDNPVPVPDPSPTPDISDAIEVTAIEAEESNPEQPESEKDDRVLSQQKIKSLEWSVLRKLAKGRGINTKGMQRHEVEQALAAKRPTRDDLSRAA
jgi:hypothetical protein